MKCFYINLEKATNRNFKIEYVESNKILGNLRSNEKACFLSHKFVIKQNLNATEPILLMDDDTVIGKSTCEIWDNFIKISNKFEWDILFTAICVPWPTTMIECME